MEKYLPKSIKLKLEQPAVMCSGRTKIECYYRGKSIDLGTMNVFGVGEVTSQLVLFKSHRKDVIVLFENGKCVTKGWEDLVIVQ